MKMTEQADAVALSKMDEICDFTSDIPFSSDVQVSKMTQDPVDSLSLVDRVLDGLDSLLGVVSVSEKDPVDSTKTDVSVNTTSQIKRQVSMPVQKPRTYTMDTQTSDDLVSDSISAMETQLQESRCKLEVMTEYYKSVEVDFRDAIVRHSSAAEKAKADLELSQKQMTELKTKLAQLEKECTGQAGDGHPKTVEVEAEAEYKPENTQGYRPRPRKNFEIREHYFPGETPPPAWARVKPPVYSEQAQMVVQPYKGNIPTPPPCYNQGYKDTMSPPSPHLQPPCSTPGLGRIPPRPPFAPRRCRSEPPPPPPPGFFMAPPRGFMPPPPPQLSRQTMSPPHDVEMEALSGRASPRPGDFVVRPMTPCGMQEGQKVRFGVREILYI